MRFWAQILLLGLMVIAQPVAAADVAATVNGDVITSADVSERAKLLKAIQGGRTPAQSAVLNELIDERIKLREATRLGAVPDDAQVEKAMEQLAKANKLTAAKLGDALSRMGTSAEAFKRRLRGELAWIQVVRASESGIANENVPLAKLAPATSGQRAVEYTLRQVVFVVPKGSGEAVYRQRMAQANALRGRFNGCESGLEVIRGMKDVAVRDPISRSSNQLGDELANVLEKTPKGKLTQPFRDQLGIEMLAVCDRVEVVDDSLFGQQRQRAAVTKAARVTPQQMEAKAKTMLAEMKSKAEIVRR